MRLRRLASNAAANYAGQITTVGVGFVLTPFLLRDLGPSLYGVWVLVVSIQGLGGLLDFGIGSSVVKYVAEHEARGESDERNRVVSTTFLLHAGIGIVALGVFALIAWLVLPLLNLAMAELAEARAALLVAAAGLMLALPLSVPGNVLTGLRRYEASNLVNVVQSVGTGALTLMALSLDIGPAGLIAISATTLVLGYLVKWAYAARLLSDLRINVSLASRRTLRRIGGYGGWLFLIDAGKTLFYNADAVLIAAFLPVSSVGAYSIGFKPASAVSYFAGPLVSVFVPAASAMDARNESAALRRLLVDGTRAAVALTLVGSVWLWAFGGQLVSLWVGPGHEDSLPVLWVFVGVFLVSSFQNPASAILRGVGEVRLFSLSVLAEYGANLILSVILIPRLGIAGAAIGTLIPALINDLLVIPWLACRALSVDYRVFILRTVPGGVLAAIVSLAVLLPASIVLGPPSPLTVLIGALVAGLVFGAAFLILGLGHDERRAFARMVRSVARRVVDAGAPGGTER